MVRLTRREIRAFMLCTLACIALTACGSGGSSTTESPNASADPYRIGRVTVKLIPGPRGMVFADPVWIKTENAVYASGAPVTRFPRPGRIQLFRIPLNGGPVKQVSLPSPGCVQASNANPQPLPDGRIGFIQRCISGDAPPHPRLMSYEPQSGAVRQFAPVVLPYGVRSFSVSSGGEIVVNDGKGLSERLHRVDGTNLEPIPLPLARVGDPSWSPDGRRLAFDGVISTGDAVGPAKAAKERDLFVLDSGSTTPRSVMGHISYASRPAWSPDGRAFVVALDLPNDENSLWLVDPLSGDRQRLAKGMQFGAAAWMNSDKIVAAVGSPIPGVAPPSRIGLAIIALAP